MIVGCIIAEISMTIEKKFRLSKWFLIFNTSGIQYFELLSTDIFVSKNNESNENIFHRTIVASLEDTGTFSFHWGVSSDYLENDTVNNFFYWLNLFLRSFHI